MMLLLAMLSHLKNISDAYPDFKEQNLTHRFFTAENIYRLIEKLPYTVEKKILGYSVEKRPIYHLKMGTGPKTILLWSQMHGNEATATAVLFDLLNFMRQNEQVAKDILTNCTLHIIPMLNPDGAYYHTRRNAQNIDMNRDFLAGITPEGNLLKGLRTELKPDFAFNLHDQEMLWGVGKTGVPTCIALLAPPFDERRSVNWVREQAMRLIGCMHDDLQEFIPGRIARWSDEFEARAFGDNFQKAGTPTILIESGSVKNDGQKQIVRKMTFLTILSGLINIAQEKYQQKELITYQMMPENLKNLFHCIVRNAEVNINGNSFKTDFGLNYSETFDPENRTVKKAWTLAEMGDLSPFGAYEIVEGGNLQVKLQSDIDETLEMDIFKDGLPVRKFRKGMLLEINPAD